MIQFTSEIIGREVPYTIKPRRTGDLPSSFCDPLKAKEILGWKAQLSIKEAIKDGFPNGATYKLIVPTSVCINQ